MRKITVKCDRCGFEKTYDDDIHVYDELIGWASMVVYGPYEDVEICPECVKSFLGAAKLEEECDDD